MKPLIAAGTFVLLAALACDAGAQPQPVAAPATVRGAASLTIGRYTAP